MSLSYSSDSIIGGGVTSGSLDQLYIRKNVLEKRDRRSNDDILFLNSSTAWVRLYSSVDKIKQSKDGNLEYDSSLARGNILAGGIEIAKNGIGTEKILGGFNHTYRKDSILGYRPMPGIIDVSIVSKNQFGTLREATVYFKANTPDQLSDLEELYMRPGQTVLLEWGHSLYLENDGTFNKNPKGYQDIADYFVESNQQNVINTVKEIRQEASYNYDGMFGFIKNFIWQYELDGTYTCKVDIISKGELLESIKVLLYPSIGEVKSTEVVKYDGSYYKTALHSALSSVKYVTSLEKSYNPDKVTIGRPAAELNFRSPEYYSDLLRAESFYFNIENIEEEVKNTESVFMISLRSFLDVLNKLTMLKTADGKQILGFYTGDKTTGTLKTPYITFPEHFALDPLKVILPKDYHEESGLGYKFELIPNTIRSKQSILDICIGVDYVLDLIDDLQETAKQGVNVFTAINTILGTIEYQLGGINRFSLHLDEEEGLYYIVDRNLTPNTLKSSALDIVGLSSQVENISLTSKITPSIATMVAISAQNTDNTLGEEMMALQVWNQGLRSRHIQKLHQEDTEDIKGEDEIKKDLVNSTNETDSWNYTKFKTVPSGQELERVEGFKLVPYLCEKINKSNGFGTLDYSRAKIEETQPIFQKLMVKLVEYHTQKQAFTPQGLIPFELSLTLRGIAGPKIGQVFEITENSEKILPKRYRGNVRFIVTGIDNTVKDNKWLTTLRTQLILKEKYTRTKVEHPLGLTVETATSTTRNTSSMGNGSTPNADNLRYVLNTLGEKYREKVGSQLTTNGDISEKMAKIGIAVVNKLYNMFRSKDIIIEFTAGNDVEHKDITSYTSNHVVGNALDFTVKDSKGQPVLKEYIDKVEVELKNFVIGNPGKFGYINEYSNPTKNSTGYHFHISYNSAKEASRSLIAIENTPVPDNINSYIV